MDNITGNIRLDSLHVTFVYKYILRQREMAIITNQRRATMFSIMILSAISMSGLKQLATLGTDTSRTAAVRRKKELGSEFCLLMTIFSSFLMTIFSSFWSSTRPRDWLSTRFSTANTLISRDNSFLLSVLSTWSSILTKATLCWSVGRLTVGWTFFLILSWSLKA